jgi:tetratricopeptide (TPR) repeat protein
LTLRERGWYDAGMYLKGNKWNMTRRTRRRGSPWRMVFFLFFAGSIFYINQFVVPSTPAFAIPTPTPTRSPESFTNEADELFAQGKFAPAILALEQAIQVDPLNKANFVALAQTQVWNGQYEEGLNSAGMALLGNENYSMGHAVRGWALAYLDEYIEAEIALRRAIELDGNNALAHAYYAEMLIRENNPTNIAKAIESSRRALELAPNRLETLRARGLVLFNTDNRREAIEMYEAAILINKNIPDLWMYLGYAYKALGDIPTAIDKFQQANILNPTDSIPDLEISRLYFSLGEYGRALQYAENAVNDAPTNPHRYGNLGLMLYRSGDYRGAISALEMAIKGGVTENGVVVKGLPLDNRDTRVADYYWLYGFALLNVTPHRCPEAVPVFQALVTGIPNYQLAVDNATEGLAQCTTKIEGTAP